MSLTICPAYDRPEEVKALFLEYTDFLLKVILLLPLFWSFRITTENWIIWRKNTDCPKADCIWRWWMTPLPAALPCIPSRIRNVS